MTQIEKAVGASQIIFPCTHPMYCWALLHAAWLSNRYIVKQGTTAFERSADRMYTGKLCLYGESVLCYIKPDRKGAPRWCKGIWLGKTLTNDTRIIGYKEGIFVTRSVRRFPNPFVLEELGDITTSPWEYGYAALGHRMMYNRHLSPPMPFGMPMIDVEAIQVKKYAVENPMKTWTLSIKLRRSRSLHFLLRPLPLEMLLTMLQKAKRGPHWNMLLKALRPRRHVLALKSQSLHLWMMLWILQMNVPRKPLGWKNHHVNSK